MRVLVGASKRFRSDIVSIHRGEYVLIDPRFLPRTSPAARGDRCREGSRGRHAAAARPRHSGRGLRAAGAAWRWGSSPAARSAVTTPQARPSRSRRASFHGRRQVGRRGKTLFLECEGTFRRAHGGFSGGCTLTTSITTRKGTNPGLVRAGSMVSQVRGQRFAPAQWPVNHHVSAHISALRALLIIPRPQHQPGGSGHRSRAPPAASGPPVCPSSDFRASTSGMPPYSLPSEASRTRSAAAPARLYAAIPDPAAATTTTLALATLKRPFPPF